MARSSTLARFVRAQLGTAPRRRPNPWPRCPACRYRVPALCPGTDTAPCGMCADTCCPGHVEDDTEKWGDR